MLLSIPLIFLITLFILKKIRKFLSNDLDKQILGIILDKFFGILYGIIFSYFIFTTILYTLEKITFLENLYNWILKNSFILNYIDNINKSILMYFTTPII